MEMPIRRVDFTDATRKVDGRDATHASPRPRRLSRGGESSDEATSTRHKRRSDSALPDPDRPTRRGERRKPAERILVVNAPRSSRVARVPQSPASPTSPDETIYHTSRGRAVIVEGRPHRRMPRTPTPFYYDEEKGRVTTRKPVQKSKSRERGRPIFRRYYSRPEAPYDWTSPPKPYESWFVGEKRGRRKAYLGKEDRRRRASHSDNERRARRASSSDHETWDRKARKSHLSAFIDPVGVRTEKRRVRRLSNGEREERREERASYSDPERDVRRERRAKRYGPSGRDVDTRRRRLSASSDVERSAPKQRIRRGSYASDGETTRKEKRASFSDHEAMPIVRRLSASDHERDAAARREKRASVVSDVVVVDEAEPRKEKRLAFATADVEIEARREKRLSFAPEVEDSWRRGRRRRRSLSDNERQERRERREQRQQRRATFSEYDGGHEAHARAESTPRMPVTVESEVAPPPDARSSYSDPGKAGTSSGSEEDARRRRHRAREDKEYRRSERRKAEFIALQDEEIRRRPAKPTTWLKPILKQARRDGDEGSSAPRDRDTPSKVVVIEERDEDVNAALQRRMGDRRRAMGERERERERRGDGGAERRDRAVQKQRLRERLQMRPGGGSGSGRRERDDETYYDGAA